MINTNYANLKNNYLFSTVAEKVRVYSEAHPQADIIKLGIGDVTKPLAKTVIQALHDAVDENAKAETFMGYGPEQGCAFRVKHWLITMASSARTLTPTKCLLATAQRATSPTSSTFSPRIATLSSLIRFTLFIWIPTSWMAARSAS